MLGLDGLAGLPVVPSFALVWPGPLLLALVQLQHQRRCSRWWPVVAGPGQGKAGKTGPGQTKPRLGTTGKMALPSQNSTKGPRGSQRVLGPTQARSLTIDPSWRGFATLDPTFARVARQRTCWQNTGSTAAAGPSKGEVELGRSPPRRVICPGGRNSRQLQNCIHLGSKICLKLFKHL